MSTKPAIKKESPKPTVREQQAAARARDRVEKRAAPFRYKTGPTPEGVLTISTPHDDVVGHVFHGLDTFGTSSRDFQKQCVGRLGAVMSERGQALPDEAAFNAGLAAVGAVAPENEIEAMLAVQMVGTHEVAMEMLTRAKMAGDLDQMDRYGTLATKLLRTYTTQIEALAKLRRGGSQKVTVEHVHVYQGGQAIVGNVTAAGGKALPGGGVQHENGHQPHALTGPAALAFQADTSMLRQDAGRDAVPVAGGGREDPVPNARRGGRKRRLKG